MHFRYYFGPFGRHLLAKQRASLPAEENTEITSDSDMRSPSNAQEAAKVSVVLQDSFHSINSISQLTLGMPQTSSSTDKSPETKDER